MTIGEATVTRKVQAKQRTSKPTREALLVSVRELAASKLRARHAKIGGTIEMGVIGDVFRMSLYLYRAWLDPKLFRRDAQWERVRYQRRLEAAARATKHKPLRRRLERAIDRLDKDEQTIADACDELDALPAAAAAGNLDDLPPEEILARVSKEAEDPQSPMMRILTQVVGPEVTDADLACVFVLVATWYSAWRVETESSVAFDVVRRAMRRRREDAAKRRASTVAKAKRIEARNRRLASPKK